MAVFHSLPAAIVLLAALFFAFLYRRGIRASLTAYLSMLCASLLTFLILLSDGTLFEALALVLLPLFLLLPGREKAP